MRNQLNINRCVGITKNGELIMVDYMFSDTMHGEPFHGVTGSRFMPISQDYIDERNDLEQVIETYGYLWSEAVKDGSTTLSQEEYMQQMIDSEVNYGEGLFLGHDTSYIHSIPDDIKATHFQGYESFECVGGGRMFPLEEEMLIIFDQDLWDAIQAVEVDDFPLDAIQSVVGGELKGEAVQGE